MLIMNHVQLLEKIYKSKEIIADAYRVDKIELDSYIFYNLVAVFTQNNGIIRFSKGLQYATFAIKNFEYDDYIKNIISNYCQNYSSTTMECFLY